MWAFFLPNLLLTTFVFAAVLFIEFTDEGA
jgi:hypothetical protein